MHQAGRSGGYPSKTSIHGRPRRAVHFEMERSRTAAYSSGLQGALVLQLRTAARGMSTPGRGSTMTELSQCGWANLAPGGCPAHD